MGKLKFEKHFTTCEQSNKLLEIGVPANSADLFYKRHLGKKDEYFEEPKVLPDGQSFSSWCGTENGVDTDVYVPCWSLGRLQEIWAICTLEDWKYKEALMGHVQWIISDLEFEKDVANIDFENLKNYEN